MLQRTYGYICIFDLVFSFSQYIQKQNCWIIYGSSNFNFLRNPDTVFHGGHTNLYSHQQHTSVPFSPHPHQHLLFLTFLTIDFLSGMRGYLILVLIQISLMTSDVQHLFMYPLAIHMSSLEKCLFTSSAPYKMSFYFWPLSCMSSLIIWILALYQIYDLQIHFPILQVNFRLVDSFLCYAEAVQFDIVPLIYLLLSLLVTFREASPRLKSRSLLSLFSFSIFMVLGLTLKYVIHFELIFVCGIIQWSTYILLHKAVWFPQHHLLKRLTFPHCIFLASLS